MTQQQPPDAEPDENTEVVWPEPQPEPVTEPSHPGANDTGADDDTA